jgi:hypothetical protein
VWAFSALDIGQEWMKFCIEYENFPEKVLAVRKKAVPLHPLSRNRGQKRTSRAAREKQVHLVFRVVKEVKAERH